MTSSKKHYDIENGSNPRTDAAASRSLGGRPQTPHGLLSLDLIIRVVFAAIGVLFIFSVMDSFFEHPEDPVILLASLDARKFNIYNSTLDATWEAHLIVENPNVKFKGFLSGIDSWVYYTEPVNRLAHGLKGPFSLDTKSNTTMIMKSSVSTRDPPQRWVVDDMEKERNGGSVNLGLEIRLEGDFTTGSFFSVNPKMTTVYCRDVKVVFPAGSTTGTLAAADKPRECSRYTW